MLLPMTLPIPIEPLFLIQATITVTNSGKDVPIAKIDIPIIVSDRPKYFERSREPSKNNFPPIKIPMKVINSLI